LSELARYVRVFSKSYMIDMKQAEHTYGQKAISEYTVKYNCIKEYKNVKHRHNYTEYETQ